ncbi:DegT/DnrJ/EryC1/StrS family aminotransferase [Pedobacter sp. SYP-B3415]|uniref:DegT/DnrJ/EryC1/StrS family aminotransferase n=1 Tax=Pedobacter sp. SYP-B3415 TaxID=2496641 RepID=UPI00101C7902|nr:DegT/DnrJ/EryC1/StrS family aminotransferase [Pedobacter sp. SYP-B3415]
MKQIHQTAEVQTAQVGENTFIWQHAVIYYPMPSYLQKAYSSLRIQRGAYPLAEEIAETCLSLPLWPGMTEEMVKTVAMAIKVFFRSRKSAVFIQAVS